MRGSVAVAVGALAAILCLVSLSSAVDLVQELRQGGVDVEAALPDASPEERLRWASQHLWGSFRPQLYLGARTMLPRGVLAGLMWAPAWDVPSGMRHTCEDAHHNRYGWHKHDGVGWGRQEVDDLQHGIHLTTHFLKDHPEGSTAGGHWAWRVEGRRSAQQRSSVGGDGSDVVVLWLYVITEGHTDVRVQKKRTEGVKILGTGDVVGDFAMVLPGDRDSDFSYTTFFTEADERRGGAFGYDMQALYLMHAKTKEKCTGPKSARHCTRTIGLDNKNKRGSNVALVQLVTRMPFTFDAAFLSGEHVSSLSTVAFSAAEETILRGFKEKLISAEDRFEERFRTAFDAGRPSSALSPLRNAQTAKYALSNLIGGIGYFYGSTIVQGASDGSHAEMLASKGLLTAVPSRPFFPRGFLWDEGFHQLLVQRFDPTLSKVMLLSWLNTMQPDGWIPREQILGPESIRKVPPEFVQQHRNHGNPLTLFLPFERLVLEPESIAVDPLGRQQRISEHQGFLERAYPLLERHLRWFIKTHQSPSQPDSFRWTGRTANHTLTSGFDDYPRVGLPNQYERHLDAYCWIMMACRALSRIGRTLGRDVGELEERLQRMEERMEDLHLDPQQGIFADFGGRQVDPRTGQEEEVGFTPHVGYVSLLPFALKIIPPSSPHFARFLDIAEELLSRCGLQSLSPKDPYFWTGEKYWRGPVWINVNYLVLSALHSYYIPGAPSETQDRARKLYAQLRENLTSCIVKEYHRSGFLWEQYNPMDGRGKGTKPFTGWTSLVLLILGEQY